MSTSSSVVTERYRPEAAGSERFERGEIVAA
jgi:hypothetical protein